MWLVTYHICIHVYIYISLHFKPIELSHSMLQQFLHLYLRLPAVRDGDE